MYIFLLSLKTLHVNMVFLNTSYIPQRERQRKHQSPKLKQLTRSSQFYLPDSFSFLHQVKRKAKPFNDRFSGECRSPHNFPHSLPSLLPD